MDKIMLTSIFKTAEKPAYNLEYGLEYVQAVSPIHLALRPLFFRTYKCCAGGQSCRLRKTGYGHCYLRISLNHQILYSWPVFCNCAMIEQINCVRSRLTYGPDRPTYQNCSLTLIGSVGKIGITVCLRPSKGCYKKLLRLYGTKNS